MKKLVYKEVIKTIESEEWDFDKVLQVLSVKFASEKPETLRSILNQEYQKRVKKTHKYQTSDQKRREVFNQFTSALAQNKASPSDDQLQIINKIAKKNKFSSAQTGKIILEEYLAQTNPEGEVSKVQISQLLKNTALIDDQKLASEIWAANLKDNNYGFSSECIKSAIGYDYEKKAKTALANLGLTYQDEHELRAKGYDKTPDIKLDIPFAYNGHVINWIESKALFGDEEHHTSYLKEQLWSYWNRYIH